MATFLGTTQEFKRYIGPRLRNLVQQLTKQNKSSAGACEHCGSGGELEAAHVHGRDRTNIIDAILGASDPDAEVFIELGAFEAAFRSEHEPFEKAFLILCNNCHRKYDVRPRPASAAQPASKSAPAVASESSLDGILPFTFEPSPVDVFKEALLQKKAAELLVYFADGRIELRQWDASRFTKTSNVLGNLRSRAEFRNGSWRREGIVKVHARIPFGA